MQYGKTVHIRLAHPRLVINRGVPCITWWLKLHNGIYNREYEENITFVQTCATTGNKKIEEKPETRTRYGPRLGT